MSRFLCAKDGKYSFTNCDWKYLRMDYNGSAISLTNSQSTLTVGKCSFIDCIADAECGGAIYVQGINKVTLTESMFIHCEILSSHYYENGGGCVYLESVTTEVLIKSSSFLDSTVAQDGPGVDMWFCSCTTSNSNTFQECMFIKCKGNDEGGGIMAWRNTYNIGISNTLFCKCFSHIGSAIQMTLLTPITSRISFSFFSDNSANVGYDLALGYNFPDRNTLLYHSFRTSSSSIIYYWTGSIWQPKDVNWLSLTSYALDLMISQAYHSEISILKYHNFYESFCSVEPLSFVLVSRIIHEYHQ